MSDANLLNTLLRPEIKELIEQHDWNTLRTALAEWPSPELAGLLLDLEKKERVLLFRALPRPKAAEAFAHLDPSHQNDLLKELADEDTRHLLANLPPDDRTHLLEELPGQVTQRVLNLLDPEDLKEARFLLGYPEESVGRLMTPDYVAIKAEWSVGKALEHVRKHGKDSETISHVYVVNRDWELVDDLSLRRLILSDPDATVSDIMDNTFVSLSAFADREEAVRQIQRYDVPALPVLDSGGLLVGIVTVDDVLDVAEQEVTEDFHKSSSIEPIRTSVREATIGRLYRGRIGWLLILVFINIFSGAGIAYYEETIEAVVALVFFLPLLIDSAGNAGSQSATLMVRAIATGDVEARDWYGLLSKELGVALGLGVTMAVAVSAISTFRAPEVTGVVATTMILVVLIGSVIGMGLPFILNRMGLDPATASAPLITSICDISGVLIYFSIASWWLAAL